MWCEDHYDSAQIVFDETKFRKSPKRWQDETIVHELLHVAWRDLDASQDDDGRVAHEKEGVIDRLARLIVLLCDE